ncbi:MAG: S-layer homology domain-containing protein [Clostridia bacterium]|nr:S-layer homology domain-containing protein [Clostridia bacterium]
MKKTFVLILTFLLIVPVLNISVYAENINAHFIVGQVDGKPGETVSVPIEVVSEAKISQIGLNISYKSEYFEYIPYDHKEDKGTVKFSIVSGDKVIDGDAVGMIFIADIIKPTPLNGTIAYLRFKIKDFAPIGKNQLNITKIVSDIGDGTSLNAISSDGYINVIKDEDITEDGTTEEDTTENDTTEDDTTEEDTKSDDNGGTVTPVVPENPSEDNKNDKPVAPVIEFTDLEGYDWAKDYILPLAQEGIIKGTGGSTYSPATNITRADFMVLLTRLLEISGEGKESFSDIPADSYFADAVNSAKALGIAKGSDNKFMPYDTISRQDMFVLVYRALNQFAYLPVVPSVKDFNSQFSDVGLINNYALDAMKALWESGIITGSDGLINPNGFATRAETAVIIYRVKNLIPKI